MLGFVGGGGGDAVSSYCLALYADALSPDVLGSELRVSGFWSS